MDEWMNELQGLNRMKKGELIEESTEEEEYSLYVIDLWKKTTCLTHRLYSHGKKNTIKFLLKDTNHVESRLDKLKGLI